MLELRETNNLNGGVDKTTGEEVNGLSRVGTVTDVRALDADSLDNVREHLRLGNGAGGQTNQDDGTSGANVLSRDTNGLLRDSNVDDSVGTTVGSSNNILDNVLGSSKVNKGLTTELLDKLSLGITSINTNDTETHGLGVLNSKRTETTTGTGNGNPLTRASIGNLQGLVDSDTSTENGGDLGQISALGDLSGVDGLGSGVLLEGTVVSVTRKNGGGTVGLSTLQAEFTAQAGAIEPLDTGVVANLKVGNVLTLGNNDTSTFVATNKGKLGSKGPVTLPGVEISVADTGVLDIDENFVRGRSGDGVVSLVKKGTTVGLENESLLSLRNRSHCKYVLGCFFERVER